jgi:hypothetical protein
MRLAALPLLLLAMSLPMLAQTGTFTATGYGTCQNSNITSQPLYCTAQLSQNGVLKGYVTFYLVQNGTTTISGGEVWRYNASDQQSGYWAEVTGSIDTANYMIHFTFNNANDTASFGYKIQPGFCSRYCHPPRVVITSGIVTFQ